MQSKDTGKIAAGTRTANRLPSRLALAGTSAFLQYASVVAIFGSTAFFIATASPIAENVRETEWIDQSNQAAISIDMPVARPEGHTSYDTRTMLVEKTSRRVQDLIQEAAASHSVKGSVAQKVGDYYASLMDQYAIEARGLSSASFWAFAQRWRKVQNEAALRAQVATDPHSPGEYRVIPCAMSMRGQGLPDCVRRKALFETGRSRSDLVAWCIARTGTDCIEHAPIH